MKGLTSATSFLALYLFYHLALTTAALEPKTENVKQSSPKKYCTPSSRPACWPSDQAWSAFNKTVGGKLIKVKPWAEPCFANPGPFDKAKCQNIKLSYPFGSARANQPGTAQLDNWAYCYTDKSEVGDCSISAASFEGMLERTSPEPFSRQCRLGRISPFAVAVTSPQDVQKALTFAKKNNIKVVIKNTGHDYLGRGTAPDSLMIWTHNLQSLKYNPTFIPAGGSKSYTAIIMGAGVLAEQGYRFAASKGKDITLGAYGSVGVAGGFAQGGGHGPLQPKYGLAVDNILQYTVVTADNKITIANAFQNSDLYFALRGGGGGTWGVVVGVVYKVYDALPITTRIALLQLNRSLNYTQRLNVIADIVENLAAFEVDWRKKGWSAYIILYKSYFLLTHLLPGGSATRARKDMAPFSRYLQQRQKSGQWNVVVDLIWPFPNFQSCFELILDVGGAGTPVAYSERVATRLINVDQYTTLEKRRALGKAVAAAYDEAYNDVNIPPADLRHRFNLGLQIMSTGPLPARFGGPTGIDTGVNTAWRDSIWEVALIGGWTRGISQKGRNAVAEKISRGMDFLRPMGSGCYYNEADVLETDWKTAFFGGNYERLLEIKRKWDPDNMFVVYKGVGYEGQEEQDAFDCYQQA